ncbi:hypothetical protein KC360_g233 [Hortaea werneckii]|nr:hypothetical protein KC344_g235 [Hortaea werneckii]KAI7180406.1 hypothetical protein KC360_g233 [Hortaea werneckii]
MDQKRKGKRVRIANFLTLISAEAEAAYPPADSAAAAAAATATDGKLPAAHKSPSADSQSDSGFHMSPVTVPSRNSRCGYRLMRRSGSAKTRLRDVGSSRPEGMVGMVVPLCTEIRLSHLRLLLRWYFFATWTRRLGLGGSENVVVRLVQVGDFEGEVPVGRGPRARIKSSGEELEGSTEKPSSAGPGETARPIVAASRRTDDASPGCLAFSGRATDLMALPRVDGASNMGNFRLSRPEAEDGRLCEGSICAETASSLPRHLSISSAIHSFPFEIWSHDVSETPSKHHEPVAVQSTVRSTNVNHQREPCPFANPLEQRDDYVTACPSPTFGPTCLHLLQKLFVPSSEFVDFAIRDRGLLLYRLTLDAFALERDWPTQCGSRGAAHKMVSVTWPIVLLAVQGMGRMRERKEKAVHAAHDLKNRASLVEDRLREVQYPLAQAKKHHVSKGPDFDLHETLLSEAAPSKLVSVPYRTAFQRIRWRYGTRGIVGNILFGTLESVEYPLNRAFGIAFVEIERLYLSAVCTGIINFGKR